MITAKGDNFVFESTLLLLHKCQQIDPKKTFDWIRYNYINLVEIIFLFKRQIANDSVIKQYI